MALSIKNADTERLARELAEITGKSITDAVTGAVRASLTAARAAEHGREGVRDALLRISADAAHRWSDELRTADHGDVLYDEQGLPR